jgi:NAD(P)-dependent dehydrogenase (short-subunit alcohol dehydrogenase family)
MEGKVALVTGGGRGIGRAIALALAQRGVHVGLNYRVDEASAQATVADLEAAGVRSTATQGDVADPDQVAAVVAGVRSQLGPIDFLVNNAGFSRITAPDALTFREWRKIMGVNLDGPFLTTWAVKDEMAARGGGAIVNIGSIAAVVPNVGQIHYGTAKAAVAYFTAVCAKAFAGQGIRVNGVAPGFVWTDRSETVTPEYRQSVIDAVPMRRGGDPAEIAAVVCFLLSEEASYVTGQTITVAGGRS